MIKAVGRLLGWNAGAIDMNPDEYAALVQKEKTRQETEAEKRIKQVIAKRAKVTPQEAQARIAALVRRREAGIKIEVKPDYRVLLDNEIVEIREYPPHKRTITVGFKVREETKSKYDKKQYFVQMPYCIFARRKVHPAGVPNLRRREGGDVANDYRGFYLVFAKESVKTSKDIIYMPTLPNMYEDFKICEGSAGGHNFDSRVSNYWNSEFLPRETPYGSHALSQIVGIPRTEEEYFALWAKLELKDFARLSYAARTIEQTKFCQGTFFGYSQEEWEKTQPKKKQQKAKLLEQQELAEREDREDHVYRIQCAHCGYRFNYAGFIIPNGDHWAAQVANFEHETECENCGYFFWPGDGFPVPIE